MAEDQQQQQGGGGLLSGVGDTIGKVGGGLGLGGSSSKAGDDQVPEHYRELAQQQQQKGAEGVQPIDENESDREIAKQLIGIIEPALRRIEPYLQKIDDELERVNRKRERKENIDEKELVETLKPDIEEASRVLNETLGALNGADPGSKIRSKAQYKKSQHEASPEENHLAELVAKLSGDVSKAIDKAKKTIQDMPHAKKDLGPLLSILTDPLVQILSAVGLLVVGVLNLVWNLLGALHLDGLVKGLLGGLGLDKLFETLGLGKLFGK